MNKTYILSIILFLTLLVSTPGCSGIEEYQERREVMSSINDLKDDDPEVRLEAIENLSRYNNYHELVVPALIDAMQDEDPRVKKEALQTLNWFNQGLKVEDVLPIIIEILKDPDEAPDIKSFSAFLLGTIGFDANDVDPIVIDLLIEKLQDENVDIRSGAAFAFIFITSIERAIQPLTDALDDESPYVRGRAAVALGRIGQRAEHAIPKIIELLNDEEFETRYFATAALIEYGPLAEDAIPAIVEAIVGGRIYFQDGSDAIRSIAQVDERVVEMLVGWLNESEDRKLRLTASKALGYFRLSSGVVDVLLHALSDSDAVVRSYAAESLGKTNPEPHVIDALINALDDEDLRVVRAAATSLGEFGTVASKAIPKLRETENMYIQFNVQNEDGSFQDSDDYDAYAVFSTKDAASDAIDKIEGSGE